MIKEILILILFYQHSSEDYVDEFEAACLFTKGYLVADENICIPGIFKDRMQWQPSDRIDKRPEIVLIRISDFKVIEIGTSTLTLSMNIAIYWMDNRPILESNIPGSEMIYLREEDKKKIWSPHIVISSFMISKTVEEEEFGFRGEGYTISELSQKYKNYSN